MARNREDLKPILEAVAGRIHYAEGRRTNFTVIAGVFIAGGLAILGIVFSNHLTIPWQFGLGAAGGSLIVLGALLFWIYAAQTNRYPWTGATKTWKWFYRDALPNEKALNPAWVSYFNFSKEKSRIQSEYSNQLPAFKKKILSLSFGTKSYDQDIEQLYVLHIGEKYKNLHLSELRNVLNNGIVAIVLFSTAATAIGLYYEGKWSAPLTKAWPTRYGSITAHWRHIQISGAPDELLINVVVDNRSNQVVYFPKWKFQDNYKLEIPAIVIQNTENDDCLPPRSTKSYSLVLRGASNAVIDENSLQAISE